MSVCVRVGTSFMVLHLHGRHYVMYTVIHNDEMLYVKMNNQNSQKYPKTEFSFYRTMINSNSSRIENLSLPIVSIMPTGS